MTVAAPPGVTVRRPRTPDGCAEEWRLDTGAGYVAVRLYRADPGAATPRGQVLRAPRPAGWQMRTGPSSFGPGTTRPGLGHAIARLMAAADDWLADQLDTAPPPAPAGGQLALMEV